MFLREPTFSHNLCFYVSLHILTIPLHIFLERNIVLMIPLHIFLERNIRSSM
jgi:hypothetical protein